MLVQFDTTGELMFVGDGYTFYKLYAGGPWKVPILTTPYAGTITNAADGGSFLGYNAGAGKSRLAWRTPSNAFQTSWILDNENAVDTAIAELGAAYAVDPESFQVLYADGTVEAGS